jgi:hypothetical protein
MSEIERRAYTENVVAQEAAYWYCREHGIRVDDLDIGQILQVAAPIILATENEKLRRLLWRIAKGEPWSDVAVEVYDAAGADPGAIPPDWLVFEGRLYGLRDEPASVVQRVVHVEVADQPRCQHCPNLADERSFMCEACAATADEEVQTLREISNKALRLAEALYRAVEFEAGNGQAIADEIKALYALTNQRGQ